MAEPSEEALAAAEKFLLAQAFDPCGHNNDLMTEQPAPYEIGSCPMDCETTFLARALDAFAADAEERGRREERERLSYVTEKAVDALYLYGVKGSPRGLGGALWDILERVSPEAHWLLGKDEWAASHLFGGRDPDETLDELDEVRLKNAREALTIRARCGEASDV